MPKALGSIPSTIKKKKKKKERKIKTLRRTEQSKSTNVTTCKLPSLVTTLMPTYAYKSVAMLCSPLLHIKSTRETMRSVETAQYPAGQCRQEVETAVKGMRSGTGQPGLRSGFNPI
jgi:hypothetical protein